MKPASIKPVRCAIYTRVSTEHFRLRDKWPSDQGPETTCTLRALDAVKHSTAPPRPPPGIVASRGGQPRGKNLSRPVYCVRSARLPDDPPPAATRPRFYDAGGRNVGRFTTNR